MGLVRPYAAGPYSGLRQAIPPVGGLGARNHEVQFQPAGGPAGIRRRKPPRVGTAAASAGSASTPSASSTARSASFGPSSESTARSAAAGVTSDQNTILRR